MSMYERSDDPAVALQATTAMFGARFDQVASACGVDAAAAQVTAVADSFVTWLRRTATLTLQLVAIEEQDTGEIIPFTPGETMAVTLDTSQLARFDINSRDDRGFLTKAALDLTVTGDNITAEVVETPDPATPNQLVVTAVQPGAGGLVVLSVPDNDTIADASEAFDVTAGGVESVTLGAPVIEEQP